MPKRKTLMKNEQVGMACFLKLNVPVKKKLPSSDFLVDKDLKTCKEVLTNS